MGTKRGDRYEWEDRGGGDNEAADSRSNERAI